MADVPALVDAHLRAELGGTAARASVVFLGAERVEVLRWTDGELLRYVTLGMSARPMAPEPEAGPLSVTYTDPVRGPRAELVLTVRAGGDPALVANVDKVLRPLAVLAASPQVEGVVVAPGSSLDTGAPLWPGAPFQAVLVGEGGGLLPDLALPAPMDPVRFLPLLPVTPNEAAWKRVHGAEALRERWLRHGTDLRDPNRRPVPLD